MFLSYSIHVSEAIFLIIWRHRKLLYLFYFFILQNINDSIVLPIHLNIISLLFFYYFFPTSLYLSLPLSYEDFEEQQIQNPSHLHCHPQPPPLPISHHYHNPNPPNLQQNHLNNQPKFNKPTNPPTRKPSDNQQKNPHHCHNQQQPSTAMPSQTRLQPNQS